MPAGVSLLNLKNKSVPQNGEASTLLNGAAEFAVILCEKLVPGRTPGAGPRKRPDFRSKMLVLMTSPGPALCPMTIPRWPSWSEARAESRRAASQRDSMDRRHLVSLRQFSYVQPCNYLSPVIN